MKVFIGNYRNWWGPHQFAQAIFFWCDRHPIDDSVLNRWDYKACDKLSDFLAHGFVKEDPEEKQAFKDSRPETWFYKLCSWVESKKKRRVYIKIDYWDSWNAEHTLSLIALPLLKDLQKDKHGAPIVDDEDVPEELRSTNAPPKEYEWDTDALWFKRWDWVLSEIIWAHEQIVDGDWEKQYCTGVMDYRFVKTDDSLNTSQMVAGPNHTYKRDEEAIKKHQDRINNGLILFGKYYQGLWS